MIDPKTGAGKPQLALIPWGAVIAMSRVLDMGAIKYGRDSWKNSFAPSGFADGATKYLSAALRHIAVAAMDPQARDEESGEYHLAHAMCNIAFVLDALTSIVVPNSEKHD